MADLLPDERQVDELAILVAIAHDGAALGRQRQYRHQLWFGTGFQSDGDILGGNDVLDHRLLLVDLDRVQRGVAATVGKLGDVAIKGAGQLSHTVLENVRKAHQQRQIQAAVTQLGDELVQVDGLAVRPVRHDLDVPSFIGVEIPGAPMADAIDAAAVAYRPG